MRSSGKAYKHSDYTVVIAIMLLDKRIIIVLKLTLVVEIQALLSCHRPPLLDRSLRRWLPVQSYEGLTKILTTLINLNNQTSQHAGKVYRDSDYNRRDRYHALTQPYNNCTETHLGGGVMGTFVFP